MKKALFLLLAICFVPFFGGTVNAQSIIGTWVTDGKDFIEEDEMRYAKQADLLFTFNGNKTLTVSLDYHAAMNDDDISGEFGLMGSTDGTYKIKGKELTITCSKQPAKINYYKADITLSPEAEAELPEIGTNVTQMKKVIMDLVVPEVIKSSFDGIGGKMTIDSLTATQLVLTDSDGITMTFRRK